MIVTTASTVVKSASKKGNNRQMDKKWTVRGLRLDPVDSNSQKPSEPSNARKNTSRPSNQLKKQHTVVLRCSCHDGVLGWGQKGVKQEISFKQQPSTTPWMVTPNTAHTGFIHTRGQDLRPKSATIFCVSNKICDQFCATKLMVQRFNGSFRKNEKWNRRKQLHLLPENLF